MRRNSRAAGRALPVTGIVERMADEELDAHEGEARLTGRTEPPPESRVFFSSTLYSGPVPFGEPPSEPVEIVGEVPWELRDTDDLDDDES
jgi:hypothetical protein